METCFPLLLLAMVTLTYADCPEGMCCPAGDNCEVYNRLCKPNPARDCRGGNLVILQYTIMKEPYLIAGKQRHDSMGVAWNHLRISFT